MDLQYLTDAELIALGCRVNGGSFGVDPHRKTPTKVAKMAYVRECAKKRFGDNANRMLDKLALSILEGRKQQDGGRPDLGGTVPGDGEQGAGDAKGGDAGQGEAQGELGKLPDGSSMEKPGPDAGKPTEPFYIDVREEKAADGQQGDGSEQGARGPQQGTGNADEPDMLEARVRKLIDKAMGESLDETADAIAEAVDTRLADAVAAIRKDSWDRAPQRLELAFPDVPAVETGDKHPVFSKLLALCALPADIRQPVMLVGPAGSGKSTAASQVATALGLPFGALSLSADMTRGAVEGRVMPLGEGRYVSSEFVRMLETGGVYLFDEIDAAAAEVLVTVNAPLANGGMHVEARALSDLETFIPKHENLRILAAANTFGYGPTAQYVGRSQMDAATLDRWLVLYMDHDYSLWARTMGVAFEKPAPWVPVQRSEDELAEALRDAYAFVKRINDAVTATQMKQVVSYRAILRARACLVAGFSWDDTREVLLAGWSQDDRAKVGA